jgi:hypothetical protein
MKKSKWRYLRVNRLSIHLAMSISAIVNLSDLSSGRKNNEVLMPVKGNGTF